MVTTLDDNQISNLKLILMIMVLLASAIGFNLGNIHSSITYEQRCNEFITTNYLIPQLERQGYYIDTETMSVIKNTPFYEFNQTEINKIKENMQRK